MNNPFQKRMPLAWRQIFLLIFCFIAVSINSCKKDTALNNDHAEKPGSGTGETVFGQQKAKAITFQQFLD